MLSREKFKEYINFIIRENDLQDKFCSMLEDMAPGNYCDSFIYAEYETNFVDLIAIALGIKNDEDKFDTFTTYLYEYDYGRADNKYKDEVPCFKNLDTLYDYLISEEE